MAKQKVIGYTWTFKDSNKRSDIECALTGYADVYPSIKVLLKECSMGGVDIRIHKVYAEQVDMVSLPIGDKALHDLIDNYT